MLTRFPAMMWESNKTNSFMAVLHGLSIALAIDFIFSDNKIRRNSKRNVFLVHFSVSGTHTFSSNILKAGDDWHFNNQFKSLNAETSERQQQWDKRNFLVLIAKSEAEALIISSTAEWNAIFADDERREVFIKSLIRIIFNHERLMLMCDHFPHYVHMCSS